LLALSAFVLGATPAEQPTLRLDSRAPVVVHGTHFRAGERVTLVLGAGQRSSTRVRAGAAGAFRARFAVSLGRCALVSVQAFGSQGSRARLLRPRAPDCVPGD
jgi:hypothetical protein